MHRGWEDHTLSRALLDANQTKITEHRDENPGLVQNSPYNGKQIRVFLLSNFHVARTEAGRLHSMLQLLKLIF